MAPMCDRLVSYCASSSGPGSLSRLSPHPVDAAWDSLDAAAADPAASFDFASMAASTISTGPDTLGSGPRKFGS